MKKLTLLIFSLLLLAASQNAFAQCSIDGPDSFDAEESGTYSIPPTTANIFWSATGDLDIVGNNNTSSSVEVTASAAGSGSLCVTVFEAGEAPCCDCTNVIVEEPEEPECIPPTSISIAQMEPGNGCPGDDITFTSTVQPNDVSPGSYAWEVGTGSIFNPPFFTATTSSITFSTAGKGESIWVKACFTACDKTVCTMSLVQWKEDCFVGPSVSFGFGNANISPNPFKDSPILTYESANELDAQIEIYNINGQLIHSKATSFYSGHNEIELNDFPNSEKGILFYQIRSNDEILGFGKMHKID